MKKILFMAAMAVFGLSSCSNDDDATGMENANSNEIVFKTSNHKVETRSVTTSLNSFYVTVTTETGAEYINRAFYSLSGGVFTSTGHFYWPLSGNLNFFALNTLQKMTITDGIPSHTFTDVNGDADYVAAVKMSAAKCATVPLTFKHILTRIGVKVLTDDDMLEFNMKSLKMTTPCNGTYTFDDVTGGSGYWNLTNDETKDYSWTANMPFVFGQGDEYIGTQYFNVVPHNTTITFTAEYEVYENGVKVADYTGDNAREVDIDVEWSAGQAVNYVLYLSSHEDTIKFTSTVSPWSASEEDDGYEF